MLLSPTKIDVRVNEDSTAGLADPACRQFLGCIAGQSYAYDARWQTTVCQGLNHRPYLLTAWRGTEVVGLLPLAFVKSAIFGRFLVSLPYVNSAGVMSECPDASQALVDRAVSLADELRVRYLELRHEKELPHPA